MFRVAALSVVFALLVTVLTPAGAQQAPTKTLYLTLLTRTTAPMKFPGMEQLFNMPGMQGVQLGAPERSLLGRAVYATKPAEPLFVTVPTDLSLPANKLLLHLPKAEAGEDVEGEEGGEDVQETPKDFEVVNKLYWHPDVAKGPLDEGFKVRGGQMSGQGAMPGLGMPNLDNIIFEQEGFEALGSESKFPQTARGQGSYVCNTGGTATLDGFLPPLLVSAPDMTKLKPAEGIMVQWAPVAGARGYLISANGMNTEEDENNAKMTTISWFSTLVAPPMRIRGGYRQETSIADDLANGILLPGTTTSCKIPGGIFNEVMMLSIRVEAIGNDFYSSAGGRTVFGTIRAEWNATGMLMEMGEGDDED